jgi:hypothetical protein
VVRITKAETFYSFSAEREQYADKLFKDMHHLTLNGYFLSPQKLTHSQVILSLIGERDCLAKDRKLRDSDWLPSIGELSFRAGQNRFLGVLPNDCLWGLASAIDRGAITYARLNGTKVRGGAVRISWIGFVESVDLWALN